MCDKDDPVTDGPMSGEEVVEARSAIHYCTQRSSTRRGSNIKHGYTQR